MPIHEVTLADVYRLDFGRRTDDAATWAALSGAALGGPVLDVCCGDGRATRGLLGERTVYGVDQSAAFVSVARDAGIKASVGGAERVASLRAAGPRPALVVCAYSSLLLLPHARQAEAIEAMAEVALPGALVAVEAFVPKLTSDRVVDQTVANPNDPTDHRWVRRTTYEVDTASRTTRIARLYGPDPEKWTMQLSEVVYWRDPDEIALLFRRAGLVSVDHSTTTVLVLDSLGRRSVVPVAPGMALTVGRR
jgi:SAM-dependent methyltransferase